MPRRYWLVPLALALVASLAIHPAPTTATTEAQPISQVRVVHALPGAPPVDVFVDGARIITALTFGVAVPYINLPAGPHEVTMVPAGAVPPTALISTAMELAPGQAYTLMAIGAPGVPPVPLVLEDARFTPIGGPARVRFVHASPNAPPVDVAISSGAVLFSNVAFGQATPYVEMGPGTESFTLRVAGADTVVLAIPDVVLAVSTIYTFAAIGVAGGTPPLGPLPLIDS
jgi:hypothetical protein